MDDYGLMMELLQNDSATRTICTAYTTPVYLTCACHSTPASGGASGRRRGG
ncbi:hypothetical protein JYU34_011614 [Plutella xylostella]|uniref:Uncharacterized protein n=1 Tax=Plutella xylostella TaxID=51655 RepID=A0ABQ7QHC4_PLUXY|nr:hypothetical protein JYU34_011614 [Plutella xylostella]